MPSAGENIPLAPVQRWNAYEVYVRCPFCTKIHFHGFGSSYASNQRIAHCNHSDGSSVEEYRFSYPFSAEDGTTAYEIDKSAEYFVALGAQPPKLVMASITTYLDDYDLSEDESPSRRKWEDSAEIITITIEDDKKLRALYEYLGGADDSMTCLRMDSVISKMVSGDRPYVEAYIRTSPEADLFLHGTDEHGQSALGLAACEKYPDIVKLLLEEGVDVDHQDKRGRTPLMNAALWGRIDNVKHLLNYGAGKNLRDGKGRRAIELSDSSTENEEERYWKSGGSVQVYQENTLVANRARRVIYHLLKDPGNHDDQTEAQRQTFQAHSFVKTEPGKIHLVAPVVEFSVPTQWKTIATLQRGPGYPLASAVSGWGHEETKVVVSGMDWTDAVIQISRDVGHDLALHPYDRGVDGRYHASHAEKQLIAYYISKHVLLGSEGLDLLWDAKPPVFLTDPTILVSKPVCDDCSRFIKAVNSKMHVDISVVNRFRVD